MQFEKEATAISTINRVVTLFAIVTKFEVM